MRLQLQAFARLVLDGLDVDFDEGFELVEAHDPGALDAAHQHLDAGGRLAHASNLSDRPDAIEVRLGRVVDLGVLLGHQQDALIVVHRGRNRRDRRPATHRKGHDQLGEDDVVPQRHQGHPGGRLGFGSFGHGVCVLTQSDGLYPIKLDFVLEGGFLGVGVS